MDVILRQDVDNLGSAGEIVSVKAGYARNFLLPRGLAYLATAANRRRLEAERHRESAREAAAAQLAQEGAERLSRLSVTVSVKAGEEDRLFGSVTAADIAAALQREGVEVDKRAIELEEPIKVLGVYRVPVRLHPEVRAEVRVWVVKE